MQINYWTKDQTRQEIITKTQIPNKENFKFFANYYNLIDKKGLGLQLSKDFDLTIEKFYRKNEFEYIVLDISGHKELFILPNENIGEFTNRVILKIDFCKSEKDILDLLIDEMN